jgi:hypothetical protein
MVILIALMLVALAAGSARAAVVPLRVCQTAIDVSSTVDLEWTFDDVRRFREEAERAWTPLGVDICWRGAQTPCADAAVTLYVRIADDVPTADPSARRALGWIAFSDITGPGRFIVLSLRLAIEMLGRAERAARRLSELPGMVGRLLPRALGRALAHELGHYLLARRTHSSTGLMREAFRPEDLADPGEGQRMHLSRRDRRALAFRCAPCPVRLTADAAASAAPE